MKVPDTLYLVLDGDRLVIAFPGEGQAIKYATSRAVYRVESVPFSQTVPQCTEATPTHEGKITSYKHCTLVRGHDGEHQF